MKGTTFVMVLAAGLLVTPARAGDVHIGINIGTPPPPPPVVVAAPPPLLVVPQSSVYYAPEVPYNYFYYGGLYYTFSDGYWFSAASYNGPWGYVTVARLPRPILTVPVRYYNVPPGHWKKHGRPHWDDHDHGRGHGHEHGRGHGHHGHDD